MLLSDSIKSINSLGETRAKKLEKLGIVTINDLIEYYPRNYDDRRHITNIADIKEDQVFIIKASIVDKPEVLKVKNMTILKMLVKDDTGVIEVCWFNQAYLKNAFIKNESYMFIGKVINKFNRWQMQAPEYQLISYDNDNKSMLDVGKITPIYSSTYKFSQKLFRNIMNDALQNVSEQINEIFPLDFIKNNNLCTKSYAINNIHFPEDTQAFFDARRRLVFEEFFLLQMKLLQIKGSIEQKECVVNISDLSTSIIENQFEFDLTNAQQNVLAEIKKDLTLGKPMNRLIQGDVGSGKTAIAQILSYIGINNGYQVAIMAPTEVLASQHLESFKKLFKGCSINNHDNTHNNIKCVFLSGSQKASEKKANYKLIESGEANIIIGTHAIIQDKVNFYNLGIVVTDEQHRFGVKQREQLSLKGGNPHTLVMTATPIPRTLALILYGDLDISIIDELPPNRQVIETIYVNSNYYPRIYNFIKSNANQNKQSYIICPTIEESEKSDLKSVIEYTEKLKQEIFIGSKSDGINYTVEYIHGKMKNSLKQEVMEKYYSGEIDVLVSTTVIEVGINVPNATIMLIENAERFGISQLHQLRGRVGRGADKSYCILVSDSKNKDSIKRLNNMVEHSNGFILSEKDLENRGGGDFFGTRQHGVPELKIGNLYKDLDLLKEVQNICIDLYREDPLLQNPNFILLKEKINHFFNDIKTSSVL